MRIIHSIPSLVPESGGTARAVVDLCSSLAQRGNSIELISLDIGNKFGSPIVPPSHLVKTHFVRNQIAIGLRQLWAPKFKNKLQNVIEESNTEILHDHCIWLPTNSVITKLARKKKIPLIVTLHGMLEPWALQSGKYKKQAAWVLYQRRNLEQTTVLHATTEIEAENARKFGVRQPIAVVPYIIRLPELTIHKYPEPDRQRTILFLSRIHHKKGLLNLVKAVEKLDLYGWKILIAGPDEGGHQAEVEELICRLGLTEKFQFLGPINQDDKWELYRQSDLFVLPTFSENFGIVILEALACGLPVITTKGTPWHELETYNCGWWIDVGVESLITALRHAMSLTDDERFIYGLNGHKLIHEKYSWEAVTEKMFSVYQWMLGIEQKPDYVLAI